MTARFIFGLWLWMMMIQVLIATAIQDDWLSVAVCTLAGGALCSIALAWLVGRTETRRP